jgi:hypothetical protein
VAIKTIYQTLEDRGNRQNVELEGPFPCNWDNTWLGDGYYFWDTFIENAHWWGKEIRKYENGYFVCKAICDFNDTECCDLVGNTEHMRMFSNSYDFLKKEGLANETTTVKRLIHFLKDELNNFKFNSIRAFGLRSKNYNSQFSFTMNFEENRVQYLDLKPAIQICFYSKTALNLRNYTLIYPPEYTDDYLV